MNLQHVESNHVIEVDDRTGLATSITAEGARLALSTSLRIKYGGGDRRNPVGGLEYYDTTVSDEVVVTGKAFEIQSESGPCWAIPVTIGPANAQLRYTFNRIGPALSLSVHLIGDQELVVRNLMVDFDIDLGSGTWTLDLPGNGVRSSIPLKDLATSVGVSPMGGLRGSSGLVYLAQSDGERNLALWVDGAVEIPEVEISSKGAHSALLAIKTEFCSDLSRARAIDLAILSLDLLPPAWERFPELFQSWLDQSGVTSPSHAPEWVKPAMIFEAQLGYSIFGRVNTYGPYPTATDLIADLDRIKAMGFSCIQLMPRQPYPSYNVHDYWDIDTSYGEKGEIKRLVVEAHRRGIKVIFDVLLHGVLDKESITSAADGVRSGPYKDRIDETTYDSFSTDIKDPSNYYIAWSRHIIDFEDAWRDGSPQVSPLIAQHPEWFYRDAKGEVTGVYTKAFDARSASWQEYFMEAMLFLMRELDIDGFRFDAPTYNEYPNWADWASGRANASALACVGLFQKLRPRIKEIKADALMYTEPSGHLLRKSMDLNYNYDEQWLVTSLASEKARPAHGIRHGKDLARWMSNRDALLPRGSMTAHHIDSHDTFWWPSWGIKWRREQFGLQMTQLLTCIFGSLPGPFMMFIGGEQGIEEILPRVAAFKQANAYRFGKVTWGLGDDVPDQIFAITYSHEGDEISMMVNTSDKPVRSRTSLTTSRSIETLVGSAEEVEGNLLLEAYSACIVSAKSSVKGE